MAESRKPVISVHDLAKNYGELKVLRKIDMDIYKGEVVSVIGPSGSGKSTFLRCLNYLEELTSGEIDIGGVSLKGIDEDKHNKKLNEKAAKVIRKNVGMVFQQFNLWPHKTVLENVMECPVQVKKANKEETKKKAMEQELEWTARQTLILLSFQAVSSSVWLLRGPLQWSLRSYSLTSRLPPLTLSSLAKF